MDKRELTILPVISISPSKICTYSEVHWTPTRPCRGATFVNLEPDKPLNPKFINSTRTAEGLISKNARKKISTALDYLLLMSSDKTVKIKKLNKTVKFKICFITLTLPSAQIHSDNIIKTKILGSFLVELTKYHNVKNYIWRAEKQKNGNIHFHVIIDQFVLYNELRKRWNRICNKLGYVDVYQSNMQQYFSNGFRLSNNNSDKRTRDQQLKAYQIALKSNFTSPNSTDIHQVKYISNIKAYISKYLSKNEIVSIRIVHKYINGLEKLNEDEQRIFDKLSNADIEKYKKINLNEAEKLLCKGRLWSCNENLSDIKNAREYIDFEIDKALTETIAKSKCKSFSSDYYSVYYISLDQLKVLSPDVLFLYFAKYMIDQFHFSMQLVT